MNHVLVNAGFNHEDFDKMEEEEFHFHFAFEMALLSKGKGTMFGGI